MELPLPLTKDLVLIGGGHAHALVLRMWGMKPLAGVRVTVVNPHPTAPYSGMLPGHVAGHYGRDELSIDLVRLARFANARLIVDRASGLDRQTKSVRLESGREIRYDLASIDIGITARMPDLPGFEAHGVPVKPMDAFAVRWASFLDACRNGREHPRLAIIGGGVGGCEIAMAAAHALRGCRSPEVTIIDASTILNEQSPALADRIRLEIDRLGIRLVENAQIGSVEQDGLRMRDGAHISAGLVIGAAGARAHGWLDSTELALTDGFIRVGPTLASENCPDIFAVGDCAHMVHSPRPKAGVFAVRQAPVLFRNLRAALSGASQARYDPQRDFLKLISLGGKTAMAERFGFRPSGPAMWRWKDRIDRKFMSRFQDLKPMSPPALPKERVLGLQDALGPKPMCGGCGSKVGAAQLEQALSAAWIARREDVHSMPGDDAAMLEGPKGETQVITTDHLRGFISDTAVMARIAAIHALGDVWAMGASPQAALPQLIVPPSGPDIQADMLKEIMATASEVFGSEGCAIVGGHTSVGAELTIGFTVTGLCATPVTLAGARPGDALYLTKSIGTGTIMAGDMQLAARGEWVEAAIRSMTGRYPGLSGLVAEYANAATDITGFGLAGHALNMARASECILDIRIDEIPFIDGALELCEAGIASSLYRDNRSMAPALGDETDARVRLLHDPQTAGGILLAVSEASREAFEQAAAQIRLTPALIGVVHEGPPAIQLS